MAAKLLYSLTEDDSDSQKQMSSMTSLFRKSNQQPLLTHRRIAHKRLTSGYSYFNNDGSEEQMVSLEPSNTCLSPSSSLDNNKMTHRGSSPYDLHNFSEASSSDPSLSHQSYLSQLGRPSLDHLGISKVPKYRETWGLSAKTTSSEEAEPSVPKQKHSPRPLQLSTSMDVVSGKQNLPADDFKESLRDLARLGKAPKCSNEVKELPRSSYEAKGRSSFSFPEDDAHQFCCDGMEINYFPFQSSARPKEFPMLSLDNSSMHVSKSNSSRKRPPGIVAKLMGLEALPNSPRVCDMEGIRISSVENCSAFSTCLGENDIIDFSNSLKITRKAPASPRWKNHDSIVRPASSSRCPIEPAPWKQTVGNLRGSPKPLSGNVNASSRTTNPFPSSYRDIEKLIRNIEDQNSRKDFEALKKILDVLHVKVLHGTSEEDKLSKYGAERDYVSPNQNLSRESRRKPKNECIMDSRIRGDEDSLMTMDYHILNSKPAEVVKKFCIPVSSVVQMDDLPSFEKGKFYDSRERLTNSQTKSEVLRLNLSSMKVKENVTGSVKGPGSMCQRLQQEKLEPEKKTWSLTPSADSKKSSRKSDGQVRQAGIVHGNVPSKSPNLHWSDDWSSDASTEPQHLSNQCKEGSVQSDSDLILDSLADEEGSITSQPISISGIHSSSRWAAKYLASSLNQNASSFWMSENESMAELATPALEHSSPISVLDASTVNEDAQSPLKRMTHALRDDENRKIDDCDSEDQWNTDYNFQSNNTGSGRHSKMSCEKLQSINNLIQKLQSLNSSHDEAGTDYIASLCENPIPDHRYISEILLASGLLLRVHGSSIATFQPHSSDNPINPELFFVLEQTAANSLPSKQQPKPELIQAKVRRRLIFDGVNEILVGKLASKVSPPEPWPESPKLSRKELSAQEFLRELCLEFEQLEVKGSEADEEHDEAWRIMHEVVISEPESWKKFRVEVPAVASAVEGLIFGDIVDEIFDRCGSWF